MLSIVGRIAQLVAGQKSVRIIFQMQLPNIDTAQNFSRTISGRRRSFPACSFQLYTGYKSSLSSLFAARIRTFRISQVFDKSMALAREGESNWIYEHLACVYCIHSEAHELFICQEGNLGVEHLNTLVDIILSL